MSEEEVIIHIDWDEWYPVYFLSNEKWGQVKNISIPKKKLEWIEKTFDEFDKVQDYLIQFVPD